MGFYNLHQYGITYEPNFLSRTASYNIHEFRLLKNQFSQKINQFKVLLNPNTNTTPLSLTSPHSHSQSSIMEPSFVSSNHDAISIPPIQPTPSFHSIQVQTSLFLDDTITTNTHKSLLLVSTPSPPSQSMSDIQLIDSSISDVMLISDTPPLDNDHIKGPFLSNILNQIAIKLPKKDLIPSQPVPPPPLESESTPMDDASEQWSMDHSLSIYVNELKSLMAYNQELMSNSAQHQTATLIPTHHMPKLVDYSSTSISDAEEDLFEQRNNKPRKLTTPPQPHFEDEMSPKRRSHSTTPSPTRQRKKRKALTPPPPLVEQLPLAVESLQDDLPLEDNALQDNELQDNALQDNELPLEDNALQDNDVTSQTWEPLLDDQDMQLNDIQQQPTPTTTTKTTRKQRQPTRVVVGNRTRRKHLRKSFIDNEWVDADNVSSKQMNVVEQNDNGEYIVVEEIEKTIHGVKRQHHSAKRKVIHKKRVQPQPQQPFKIATTVCKKPTQKQIKAIKEEMYMDLKEMDNYHIGYIGMQRGVELKGTEIGDAIYVVSSGKISFINHENEVKMGKAKDVFVVNKGSL